MSTEAASSPATAGRLDQLRLGKQVLRQQAEALSRLSEQLDGEFCRAAQLVHDCRGCVIVSGMGKAGLVGQKTMATLASTGTRSHFLHPAEAIHGDLGRVHSDDVVLMLSQSGETEEIVRLLPPLAEMGVPLIAITAKPTSSLGRAADVVLSLGSLREACTLGLAPSTSTTAMIAVGDALALVVSQMKGFAAEDFARFHPGGALGFKLSRVEEVMRPLQECRVAEDRLTVRQVFVHLSRPGRRTGAIMLVDAAGRLSGIFTDSDLARLFEANCDVAFDQPVCEVMTAAPAKVERGSRLPAAVEILRTRRISELPVVDGQNCPVGMIDVTDVMTLLPAEKATPTSDATEQAAQTADSPGLRPATVPFTNKTAG
jgi:arabinose-5-phosphate isomerase